MIFQDNKVPWIILIGILLVFGLGFGFLLGNTEIMNPMHAEQSSRSTATFDSLVSQGTQVALNATVQAVQFEQNQERLKGESTRIPLEATARAAYYEVTQSFQESAATQTANQYQADQNQFRLQVEKTRTAQELETIETQRNEDTINQAISMALKITPYIVLLTVVMIIGINITIVNRSNESRAQANAAREARRLLEIETPLQHQTNFLKHPLSSPARLQSAAKDLGFDNKLYAVKCQPIDQRGRSSEAEQPSSRAKMPLAGD